MSRATAILVGLVGAAMLAVLWFISTNNSLIRKDEAVKSAWAQVENVYQRRLDLIPNLVSTVKGYAAHEKSTLNEVVEARNQATKIDLKGAAEDPEKLRQLQKSQDALSGALSKLMVVVERYPDLKANENFRDLQAQLEGTENRISVERRRFNEIAQDYNASIRTFPASFVANSRGFAPKAYFEAQAGAATAPKVQF
ncbi:MAG: LemA family protein [Deltaproteobacteria bacterium]|nr:LemA family protein [Deltaproteobacteria bacterium]